MTTKITLKFQELNPQQLNNYRMTTNPTQKPNNSLFHN